MAGAKRRRLLADSAKAQLEIDPADVSWPDDETFQVILRPAQGAVVVTLRRAAAGRDTVRWLCSEANEPASWVAIVLSYILEEKTTLGLAAPPPEDADVPIVLLAPEMLEQRALAERAQRAREEKLGVARMNGASGPWCDYLVKNPLSGKSYRVALRGLGRGESYCACPDFRKNLLGACKHVLRVQEWARKKYTQAELGRRWSPPQITVHVRYDGEPRIELEFPQRLARASAELVTAWRGRAARTDAEIAELIPLIEKLEAALSDALARLLSLTPPTA